MSTHHLVNNAQKGNFEAAVQVFQNYKDGAPDFEKNKKFYQKTLTIKDHHSFDACLVQHTQLLFQNILMENNQQKLPLKQIEQNSSFYAYGITGIIKSWLLQDCQTPNNDMENYLISVIESTIIKND